MAGALSIERAQRRWDAMLGRCYGNSKFCSGMRCLLIVIATISVVEVVIMLILPRVLPAGTSSLVVAIVDGVSLAVLSFIPLWLLLLGPLRRVAGAHRLRYGVLEAQIQDGVFVTDARGRILSVNPQAVNMSGVASERLLDSCLDEWMSPLAIPADTTTPVLHEGRFRSFDGRHRDVEYTVSTVRFGNREEHIYAVRDVSQRKAAELELQRAQKALLESSRLAGMSEVATTVLHNVGNVLNSVNIAIDLLDEENRKSKVCMVGRTAELLEEHADDLAAFMNSPKGHALRRYLTELSQQLEQERQRTASELKRLKDHIEHIKQIVQMQNAFAGGNGARQPCELATIVDEAIQINAPSLERHRIQLTRDYVAGDVPLMTDRHKVMQILVNLLGNATTALRSVVGRERCIDVRLRREDNQVVVQVVDNGEGIADDHLVKVFQYGFTTRKDGHGFGLHSAAIAAQELGGTIRAESDGPGQGACFTLRLPLQVEEPAECGV